VFEATQPIQMLMQHANQVPTPPSKETELPVPPELDALVLHLLSKGPHERPASAEAVNAALASISLKPEWTAARRREWWDTHRPVAGEFGITSLDEPAVGGVVLPAVADSAP
jgi:hypothetical protein